MNSDSSIILERRVGISTPKIEPTFSIVIPAYNLAEFIAETLDSVFSQTFTDYEVILVNDGSTDTIEFEKQLKPYLEKIVYLRQEKAGAATARNTAIVQSRGKYLAFLDGDDVWHSDYLEKQLGFIEKNGLELAYCNALFFGEKFYQAKTYMEQSPSNGKVTTEKIIREEVNFITSGTVVLREKLLRNGLFDDRFHRNEDFDLWFRLVKNGLKTDYQTTVLLKHRIRTGSLSGNIENRTERIIKAFEVIREKYELTASETKALDDSTCLAIQALLIAQGKKKLVNQNFAEAKKSFKKAQQIRFSLKLLIVIWLLNFSPKLVLKLFSKMRSNELNLIKT